MSVYTCIFIHESINLYFVTMLGAQGLDLVHSHVLGQAVTVSAVLRLEAGEDEMARYKQYQCAPHSAA